MIKNRELYSRSDMHMYLSDCIVGIRNKQGIKAYAVGEMDDNSMVLHRKDDRTVYVDVLDSALILDWPTLGVVQVGQHVSYVMMESFDSAYKKAFTRRAITMTIPFEDEVLALHSDTHLDFDAYDCMYNNKTLSFEDAALMLATHQAVRIDRDFFIGHKYGYQWPLVGYRDLIVGELNKHCEVRLFPAYAHLQAKLQAMVTTTVFERSD